MRPGKVMVYAVAMVLAVATLGAARSGFAAANNVMTVNITHGITGFGVDQPFTEVTVCVPGTTKCQAIGSLLVDTGSFGLRLFSQALTVALPVQMSGGERIAECAEFGSATVWGRVATADVKLGNEPKIYNLPVQVINPNFPVAGGRPSSCQFGTPIASSPQQLGFHGILGVGLLQSDCPACVSSLPSNGYYACTATSCTNTTEPLADQVQNPVALLPSNPDNGIPDNNGVLLNLPLPPLNGALTWSGNLIFGINTQTNNQIPATFKIYTANSSLNFTTSFHNMTDLAGFIDSGSNGLFYPNPNLPICAGSIWYCPGSLLGQTATNTGSNGVASGPVVFDINNAYSLFLTGNAALPNLGGDLGSGIFDWGLPFFLGRKVFVGIEGMSTSGVSGTDPFWAYK